MKISDDLRKARKSALVPKKVMAVRADGTRYLTTVWVLPGQEESPDVSGAQFDIFADAGLTGSRDMPEGKFVPQEGDKVVLRYGRRVVSGEVVRLKRGLAVKIRSGGTDDYQHNRHYPLTPEWEVEIPHDEYKAAERKKSKGDATPAEIAEEDVREDWVATARGMPFVVFLMQLARQSDATVLKLREALQNPTDDDERAKLDLVEEEIYDRENGTSYHDALQGEFRNGTTPEVIGYAIGELEDRAFEVGAHDVPRAESRAKLSALRADRAGMAMKAIVYHVRGRKAPKVAAIIAFPEGRTLLVDYGWNGTVDTHLLRHDGDPDVSDSDVENGYHPLLWLKPRIDEPQHVLYELIDAVYETRARARNSVVPQPDIIAG